MRGGLDYTGAARESFADGTLLYPECLGVYMTLCVCLNSENCIHCIPRINIVVCVNKLKKNTPMEFYDGDDQGWCLQASGTWQVFTLFCPKDKLSRLLGSLPEFILLLPIEQKYTVYCHQIKNRGFPEHPSWFASDERGFQDVGLLFKTGTTLRSCAHCYI